MNNNQRPYLRGVSLLAGVFVALAGIKLSSADGSPDIQKVAREKRSTPQLPQDPQVRHGVDPDFEVEIIPDALENKSGRERIAYHAELISHHKAAGGTAWTTTLVNDRGEVVETLDRGNAKVAAHGMAVTPSKWVGQKDGYYTLRVRAAVDSDVGQSVTEGVQYLAVKKGRVQELTATEWEAQSRCRQGHPVPNGGAK